MPLLTNTTQRSYKLTSQLCTGPLLAVNVNVNTVPMSCLPLRWVAGRELAQRRQQTKTAYAKCACRQGRHAPGPRLPSMRIPFPASFMLQPAGNTNSVSLGFSRFFSLVFRTSNFWSLRNLIKQLFHLRLLDMRLVIANSAPRLFTISYPTRAHGIIGKHIY